MESCPLDPRTTIQWNGVPAIFIHKHVYQGFWKNAGSTFQICPLLSTKILTLSPELEDKDLLKCWSCIFQQPWHTWLCWKIARTQFQRMDILQSRGQDFNYQCNLVKPGSQSETYIFYILIRYSTYHIPPTPYLLGSSNIYQLKNFL